MSDNFITYGSEESAEEGGEGCFIATAAYGTWSAAEIGTLRAFRDEVLLESTVGSQLVEWYYQTSPPVADFIAEHDVLRTLVRELLVDPIASLVEATEAIWGDKSTRQANCRGYPRMGGPWFYGPQY
jgi:hypothetical protein